MIIFKIVLMNLFLRAFIYFNNKRLFFSTHSLNYTIIIILNILFNVLKRAIDLYALNFE